MKKILVLFVAVMLALPAMSYAGSATSRWDLTIGGMVKFDLQWANQALNPERERRGHGLAHELPGQVQRPDVGIRRDKTQFPHQRSGHLGCKDIRFYRGGLQEIVGTGLCLK
jgi:hypothetical protein